MDFFTLAVWALTLAFLLYSLRKDGNKTKDAVMKAFLMGRGMALSIIAVIFALGLILAVIPPAAIAQEVGNHNPLLATLTAALFGTITLIPAFVAFPLIGTLAQAGVGVMPSVAFLTTLTMVGVVTFPLEKKTFGTKYALVRNGLSFLMAMAIAVAMGVLL